MSTSSNHPTAQNAVDCGRAASGGLRRTRGGPCDRPNYMLLANRSAGIDPIAVGDIQELVRTHKSRHRRALPTIMCGGNAGVGPIAAYIRLCRRALDRRSPDEL